MRRATAASFVPAAPRRISDGVSSSRVIFTVIAVSLNRATTDGSCRFEPFQITLESNSTARWYEIGATRLLCMRLGTGPSGATLESLHTVRRVAPYLRRTSSLARSADSPA